MSYYVSFAEMETEFIDRVHTTVWCNCATIDTQQRPRSRVLHPIWEGSTGWIATTRNSPKAEHLEHNAFVSLAYVQDPFKPVYAECRAEWVDDMEAKQRFWDLCKNTPEPLGYDPGMMWGNAENPAYGLLRLTPWRIELYDLLNQQNRKIWRPEK
ncbi:MAG: pyridoxamine 5'-phosphate oxidase family protein [Chloroflexota bacterium]